MHYYQFNIADYRKDTTHLSPMEHFIYRTLIDWYYLDECEIPIEKPLLLRRLGLLSENEHLLSNVLNDFFVPTEKGYFHPRIAAEIERYNAKSAKYAANGRRGGRPKNQELRQGEKPIEKQSLSKQKPTQSEKKPNQEPITKEPITNKLSGARARATRLAIETLPDDWRDWCKSRTPTLDPDAVFDRFRDYWISVPGQRGLKTDWLATWRNWCRSDLEKFGRGGAGGYRSGFGPKPDPDPDAWMRDAETGEIIDQKLKPVGDHEQE